MPAQATVSDIPQSRQQCSARHCHHERKLQDVTGQHRQSATSHDEELAREGAPLQLPGKASGLQLGHHQRQDGHVGPILGHKAGRAPCAGVADDEARLRMAASGLNS